MARVDPGITNQPVANIEWVPRERLMANGYNPNKVFPPEMELLRTSILEDGWTQPIVAQRLDVEADQWPDGEIIDGFHRWTVSADPDVAALTDGLVPVAWRRQASPAEQRMATIRHNRARGNHGVVPMANIVRELVEDMGVDEKDVMERLGMEPEELERLLDRGNMVKRGAAAQLGKGWVPQ